MQANTATGDYFTLNVNPMYDTIDGGSATYNFTWQTVEVTFKFVLNHKCLNIINTCM